jgi:hypothetical protein
VPPLKHPVTPAEADALRRYATEDGAASAALHPRIFLPIEYAEATGKAACRDCGVVIEKGERCIAFVFDPHSAGVPASWGRAGRAYIHCNCEGGLA